MALEAASPQLVFQFTNYATTPDGSLNVVYITSDATYNKVEFQVLITSGTVTLTPGTITDPNTPPASGTGTVLYLDLTNWNLSSKRS
jgi:hypothetical protein